MRSLIGDKTILFLRREVLGFNKSARGSDLFFSRFQAVLVSKNGPGKKGEQKIMEANPFT